MMDERGATVNTAHGICLMISPVSEWSPMDITPYTSEGNLRVRIGQQREYPKYIEQKGCSISLQIDSGLILRGLEKKDSQNPHGFGYNKICCECNMCIHISLHSHIHKSIYAFIYSRAAHVQIYTYIYIHTIVLRQMHMYLLI